MNLRPSAFAVLALLAATSSRATGPEIAHRCDLAKLDAISKGVCGNDGCQAGDGTIVIPVATLPDRGSAQAQGGNPLCRHDVWVFIENSAVLKSRLAKKDSVAEPVAAIRAADAVFYGVDQAAAEVLVAADKVYAAAAAFKFATVDKKPVENDARPAPLNHQAKLTVVNPPKLDFSGVKPEERAQALGLLIQKHENRLRPGAEIQEYYAKIVALREAVRLALKDFPPAVAMDKDPGQGPRTEIAMREVMKQIAYCEPSLGCWEDVKPHPTAAMSRLDPVLRNRLWMSFDQVESVLQAATAAADAYAKEGNIEGGVLGLIDRTAQETRAAMAEKQKLGVRSGLEERMRGVVLDEMGLKALYEKSNNPANQANWKEGATADQIAAVEAAKAGRIRDGSSGMEFVMTAPGAKKTQLAVPVTPEMAAEGDAGAAALREAGREVAQQYLRGNPELAKAAAAAKALPPGGDPALPPEKKDQPGSPRDPSKPGVTGPRKGSALTSGCGKGTTVEDRLKEKETERLADSAEASAERQKALADFRAEVAAANSDYEKDPKVRKILDDPLYEGDKLKHPDVVAAATARDERIAAARVIMEGEMARLESEEKQKEKDAARAAQDAKDVDKELADHVEGRIADLRAEWTAGADGEVSAGAREYVGDSLKNFIYVSRVKDYFTKQWPVNKTDPYTANLAACSNPAKVRIGNAGDVERCVGAHISSYFSGAPKSAPVKPEAVDAEALIRKAQEEQRERERRGTQQPPK